MTDPSRMRADAALLPTTVPPDVRLVEPDGRPRVWRSPFGVTFSVVETQEVVGDLGWRWGRRRAVRFAGRMNRLRNVPTHRYAVHALGLGRWRIIALQNRAEPLR